MTGGNARICRCERVPPAHSFAEASIPFVISNAVRGTWLGAGIHTRVGQIAEYVRGSADRVERLTVRRTHRYGRPPGRRLGRLGLRPNGLISGRGAAPCIDLAARAAIRIAKPSWALPYATTGKLPGNRRLKPSS